MTTIDNLLAEVEPVAWSDRGNSIFAPSDEKKRSGDPWGMWPVALYSHDQVLALLIAAMASPAPHVAEGWRDISTAPRDGTSILAATDKIAFTVWWDDEAGGWADGNTNLYGDPTTYPVQYWMPLPALPDTPNPKEGDGNV
jgi:hypothetical protein